MFVCDRENCVWGNVSRGCVYECSELWRFVFSECVGHGSSRRTVNDNGASQVMTLRTLYWEFQAVCVLPERKDRFAWGYVCKEYSSQPRAGLSQAEVYRYISEGSSANRAKCLRFSFEAQSDEQCSQTLLGGKEVEAQWIQG